MCGIVGYAGDLQAAPVLVGGLKRLEYRGYDSAGVAVLDGGTLTVVRAAGKLRNLEGKIALEVPGHGGHRTHSLGHARAASDENFTHIPSRRVGGAQRHHREPPGAQSGAQGQGHASPRTDSEVFAR